MLVCVQLNYTLSCVHAVFIVNISNQYCTSTYSTHTCMQYTHMYVEYTNTYYAESSLSEHNLAC